MTPHEYFPLIGFITLVLWIVAFIGYLPPVANKLRFPLGAFFLTLGWLVIAGYVAWLWHALERPPMRTQGETRLWYILMLPLLGLLVEWRWRTRTMAIPTIIMGAVFLIINLAKPEIFDKSLMPALQSPWFAPHVIVYMISYAAMGAAAAVALWTLVRELNRPGDGCDKAAEEVNRLVYIGFPFLTTGLIFGALWAKVAWGHYWGWDPKETWAFLSWAMYLAYIHLRYYVRLSSRTQLAIVAVGFLVVLGCWFGVNSLPSAQDSMHTYMD